LTIWPVGVSDRVDLTGFLPRFEPFNPGRTAFPLETGRLHQRLPMLKETLNKSGLVIPAQAEIQENPRTGFRRAKE
jgi:hypothetical protein